MTPEKQDQLEALRRKYARKRLSHHTVKNYRSAWKLYGAWCAEYGVGDPLDSTPEDIAGHLAELAEGGAARATVLMRMSGIRHRFLAAGQPDPTQDGEVKAVLSGIRRSTGQTRGQSQPIRDDELKKVFGISFKGMQPQTVRAIKRGQTALAVMYDGLLRVGEAAALDWKHIKWPVPDWDVEIVPVGDGLYAPECYWDEDTPGQVFIARSKTDPFGKGVFRSIRPRTLNRLYLWGVNYGGQPHEVAERDGSVFGVGPDRLQKSIRTTLNAAGLPKCTSHGARIGGTIDAYVVHDMDLYKVQILGRWASAEMCMRYLKPWAKEHDPMKEVFFQG